jgi:hypothetical protein
MQDADNCFDPAKLKEIVTNLGYNCDMDTLQRLDPITLQQLQHLQEME